MPNTGQIRYEVLDSLMEFLFSPSCYTTPRQNVSLGILEGSQKSIKHMWSLVEKQWVKYTLLYEQGVNMN